MHLRFRIVDHILFLFDEEEISGVASRIRGVVKDREHRVKLFGDEYTVLLHKCVIKQGI